MKALLLLLVACCFPAAGSAELSLPAVFGDHMVLQRDASLPVRGTADPGQEVVVRIADREATGAVAEDGRWRVDLPELPAGGPHEVTVEAGDQRRVFSDVMIGEVWVCSGQSNMDLRLGKLWDSAESKERVDADGPRLFRVERAIADEPRADLDGRWSKADPDEARRFSAVAWFMGMELQRELGVTVGLIHTAYGGTTAEAWTATNALEARTELADIPGEWDARVARWRAAGEAGADPPPHYAPGGLFNAMVHPLIPYGIRGVAWYQGESNAWRAAQYEPLLAALIGDWRARWGQPSLPFAVVQLPNYENPPRVPPAAQSWAELRESQLNVARALPGVGLVVTIDAGDPTDIHPLDKATVGRRLAGWALFEAYGRNVVAGGPLYRAHEIVGDRVYLDFDQVGSGLAVRDGGDLRGFVISGEDGRFRWAQAAIEGDRIVVTEPKVSRPVAVRYAWADNPAWANLVNREGLPASPFRTDEWPGITGSSP